MQVCISPSLHFLKKRRRQRGVPDGQGIRANLENLGDQAAGAHSRRRGRQLAHQERCRHGGVDGLDPPHGFRVEGLQNDVIQRVGFLDGLQDELADEIGFDLDEDECPVTRQVQNFAQKLP